MSLSFQQRILTYANDVEILTSPVQFLTVDVAEAVAFHKILYMKVLTSRNLLIVLPRMLQILVL